MKVELKLKQTKQRLTQSVNEFVIYLESLYNQLKFETSEFVKIMHMRIKINEKIRLKTQRINIKHDNIIEVRQDYIFIEHWLRSTEDLSKLSYAVNSHSDRDD